MKGEREHRVPLTDAAVAVLEADASASAERIRVSWGSSRHDEQHGNGNAPAANGPRRYGPWVSIDVQRLGSREDELSERGSEAALAHVVGDKVEAAYRRGDLFEKRRRLMEAWAEYCAERPAAGLLHCDRDAS